LTQCEIDIDADRLHRGPISNDREVDGFTMDNWKTQAILWPDERFTQKTEAGKIWYAPILQLSSLGTENTFGFQE
jgi:hypothetical protein